MVRRGTLPNLPYPFKLPWGFHKRLSLKLLVLTTKIPIACVGVLSNLGHALQFSPRALARFRGWDAWLSWQEPPSADSPTMAPPGPATVSEPTSSLKPGECPPWLLPFDAHVAGWRHGPLSPGARAHDTAHAAIGAPGPASCGPTRAHYAIPAPLGPVAYRGRLARCPGCPLSDTHRSQPRSKPVNRTPAPLQTGFGPTLAPTAKRLPFC